MSPFVGKALSWAMVDLGILRPQTDFDDAKRRILGVHCLIIVSGSTNLK